MLEILNVFQRRSKEELIARRMFAILIVFQRRNSLPAECWNFWTFFKEGTHCPPTIGNVDRFSKKELSCTEVVPRVNPKISNASSQIISVTIRYPRIPSDSLRFYQMLSDAIRCYRILHDITRFCPAKFERGVPPPWGHPAANWEGGGTPPPLFPWRQNGGVSYSSDRGHIDR